MSTPIIEVSVVVAITLLAVGITAAYSDAASTTELYLMNDRDEPTNCTITVDGELYFRYALSPGETKKVTIWESFWEWGESPRYSITIQWSDSVETALSYEIEDGDSQWFITF